jgi:hypothetical protein
MCVHDLLLYPGRGNPDQGSLYRSGGLGRVPEQPGGVTSGIQDLGATDACKGRKRIAAGARRELIVERLHFRHGIFLLLTGMVEIEQKAENVLNGFCFTL